MDTNLPRVRANFRRSLGLLRAVRLAWRNDPTNPALRARRLNRTIAALALREKVRAARFGTLPLSPENVGGMESGAARWTEARERWRRHDRMNRQA